MTQMLQVLNKYWFWVWVYTGWFLVMFAAFMAMPAHSKECYRTEAGYKVCGTIYQKQYPPPKVRVRRDWRVLGR